MPPHVGGVVPGDGLLVEQESGVRLEGGDATVTALQPVLRVDALVDDVRDGALEDIDACAFFGRRRVEGDADLLGADGKVDLLADGEVLVVERPDG